MIKSYFTVLMEMRQYHYALNIVVTMVKQVHICKLIKPLIFFNGWNFEYATFFYEMY